MTAFQKVTGMNRSGRATDDVVAALQTAKPPPPIAASGGPNRVEVDLPRQVLFLYEGGSLTKILTVSTGSGERFCSEGWCRRAITPQGSYSVYLQLRGWDTGPLGRLYNPQYFNGGIAVHGAPSVPPYPASHGCVRIPMHAAEWFPSHISKGMPVYVGGPGGVPGGAIPPAPPTPDTTPAPVTPPTVPPVTYVPTTPPPTVPTVTSTTTVLGIGSGSTPATR